MNKRAIVIIVCLILAIMIVAGAAAMLNRNPSEPDETVESGSVTVYDLPVRCFQHLFQCGNL